MTKVNAKINLKELLEGKQIIMPNPSEPEVKAKLQEIAEGFSRLVDDTRRGVHAAMASDTAMDPETLGLTEHIADVQQEWLPGYATLVADDGQVRVTHVDRQPAYDSPNHWIRVDQRFSVEEGETAHMYEVRTYVKRVD